MSKIEKEPTEKEEEKFEKVNSFGEVKIEEFSGLKEKLGPNEDIQMISSAQIKGKDKSVIALTNKRLIIFNSDKIKLLGKRNTFEDIKLDHIQNIEVEERKDFDIMKIKTEDGKEKKIMTTEGKGIQISGHIRDQQEIREKDPAEQLEKIGEQKEKGNISEEEFEDKKDDLMDRI